MSDSEKYEAQGKAHAALKQAKSNVATLNASLAEYARALAEASALVVRFLQDPLLQTPSLIRLSEHLKITALALDDPKRVARLVDELAAEAVRVKELQELVDKF
jgi:hypothetical protein